MRFIALFVTLLIGGGLLPARRAGAVTLDFEGLANDEAILNFYAGGLGGAGSGPGPALGVTFSSNAQALIDSDAGGTGNFANEPSPSTVLYPNGGATVDVAGGFTDFSFYYSSVSYVYAYVMSGAGGTGTALAVVTLPASPSGPGDPTGAAYGGWAFANIPFTGTARSFLLVAAGNLGLFDNVSFTPLPEPELTSLLTLSLIGIAAYLQPMRRSRRAT